MESANKSAMKVFYCNYHTGDEVPSNTPKEKDFSQARIQLMLLHSTNSFLGVVVDEKLTVQFKREEDGSIWVEFLESPDLKVVGCKISIAIAEQLLEWVFARVKRNEIVDRLDEYLVKWEDVKL